MQHLEAYLYTDDGIIASTQVTRPQQDFDTLNEIFDHVGLLTNLDKTVSMECHPCSTLGDHLADSYGLQMAGEGLSFQDHMLQRVRCPECDTELAVGSLEAHQQGQHVVAQGDLTPPPPTSPPG